MRALSLTAMREGGEGSVKLWATEPSTSKLHGNDELAHSWPQFATGRPYSTTCRTASTLNSSVQRFVLMATSTKATVYGREGSAKFWATKALQAYYGQHIFTIIAHANFNETKAGVECFCYRVLWVVAYFNFF